MKSVKQIIVIRKDLKVRKGKMMAQVAHASLACVLDMMSKHKFVDTDIIEKDEKYPEIWSLQLHPNEAIYKWLKGPFKKIVLGVQTEAELLNIYQQCKDANIPTALITDSGLTEFNGVPTNTCVGIGPYWDDEIDKITGNLNLE